MQVTGSASVAAPPARVYGALRDPAVLARTIPGCRALEETGPGAYRMTLTAGVASIQGTYDGTVELTDPDPPHAFTLRARGQGAPGTVEAAVRVRLSADGAATRVDYEADAAVGGVIGGVGQRMLGSVARRMAGEFFAAVEHDLLAPAAPAPAEPASATSARSAAASGEASGAEVTAEPRGADAVRSGRVHQGRAAGPAERGPDAWPMVAAFGAGGAAVLAGVAVGYLLGRRAR